MKFTWSCCRAAETDAEWDPHETVPAETAPAEIVARGRKDFNFMMTGG